MTWWAGRRVDWRVVQERYDAGVGARSCMAVFGLSPAAWTAAVDAGLLQTRPHGIPFDALLERRRTPGPRRATAGAPVRCRAAMRAARPPEGA